MNKKMLSFAVSALAAISTIAQSPAKVETKDAFDYNRSSLTVIPLVGHGANQQSINWADTVSFDGKFDMNVIKYRPVEAGSDVTAIQEQLQEQQIAKLIVNYWLQYNGKSFNTNILEQRARYNATDADVLKDQASKVSMLYTNGKPLIKNSYVMVAGATSLEQKTDKKGRVSYVATADAHVYQVAVDDELLEEIWSNWLDEESTPAMVTKYESLAIAIEPVASVTRKIGTGSTPEAAVQSACNDLLEPLEKKIDKWQVITSVYQRHPLGAKIGKKEGLKNSDRYAAYKVIEDADGELTFKKIAYVRATNISDNAHDASGNTECSNFYQISGRGIKEGMFLKQKKDLKLSVSLSANPGAYNLANLDVDYLINTQQVMGIMQYAGISIGFDSGKTLGEKAMWIPVSLNYGIGIHPVRILEILPSVGVGADYYGMPSDIKDADDDDSSFTKQIAYFARGGVKLGLQVWYPVQIFIRADYAYKFSEGEFYLPCDSHDRFGKLTFGAGVKVNF
ncbi:MAG: hypothetical protein K2M72_07550 [Paramuribaculum sp.]|nr:hypothetical protein [Paramuribaculum sp.]